MKEKHTIFSKSDLKITSLTFAQVQASHWFERHHLSAWKELFCHHLLDRTSLRTPAPAIKPRLQCQDPTPIQLHGIGKQPFTFGAFGGSWRYPTAVCDTVPCHGELAMLVLGSTMGNVNGKCWAGSRARTRDRSVLVNLLLISCNRSCLNSVMLTPLFNCLFSKPSGAFAVRLDLGFVSASVRGFSLWCSSPLPLHEEEGQRQRAVSILERGKVWVVLRGQGEIWRSVHGLAMCKKLLNYGHCTYEFWWLQRQMVKTCFNPTVRVLVYARVAISIFFLCVCVAGGGNESVDIVLIVDGLHNKVYTYTYIP